MPLRGLSAKLVSFSLISATIVLIYEVEDAVGAIGFLLFALMLCSCLQNSA